MMDLWIIAIMAGSFLLIKLLAEWCGRQIEK